MQDGPYHLNEFVRTRLIEAASKLMPLQFQAQYAGIGVRTYRRWRKKAEGGEEPYASLMRDVYLARAEAISKHHDIIARAADGEPDDDGKPTRALQWTASAWKLERTFPREYSTVKGLRDGDDNAAQPNSRESRIAQLREHWGKADPTDEGCKATNADD